MPETTTEDGPETNPPPVLTTAAETPATGPATDPSADEAHLQAIFPDLDPATIHDCYVLCGRNVERTVEFLLGDTSGIGTTAPAGLEPEIDLDEQLARQLEQEELSAAATAAAATGGGDTRTWEPQQHQPPVPAARQPSSLRSSQTPASDLPDFQEHFNRLAETGKRTFNTIFNKVKEKLKEFDQPSTTASAPSSSSESYYAPSGSTAVAAQLRYAPYQTSHGRPPPPSSTSGQQTTTAAESSENPSELTTATTATTAPSVPPPIDVSKAAFLAKKPTPLTETSKPHPEEDLTENPFDDRTQ